MNMLHYTITANKIYMANKIIENGAVVIEDGLIKDIVEHQTEITTDCIYNCREMQLLPGLIDTHIHGANAYDVMQDNFTAVNEVSKFLAKHGITSFVPVVMTAALDTMHKALKNIQACVGKVAGAEILGSYVEGPYLTSAHRGAHPENFLRPIRIQEVDELINTANHGILTVTVAPEKKNAIELIRHLVHQGIHVSLGHTDATYEEMTKAVAAGADIAVHTYNGMRGLHHREPGAVGAVLTNDHIYAELIADFIHVHPAAMEILLRCKPKDKIVLISDAIEATGLEDGKYKLGQLQVTVKDSIARVDSGSLAGSTTNLLKSVIELIAKMAVNPVEAINMASRNPAQMLGLENQIGSIKIGNKANLVIVDNQFQVAMTLIKGKIVYKSDLLPSNW